MRVTWLSAAGMLGLVAGCSDTPVSPSRVAAQVFAFDFANGPQGWIAGFAEYNIDQEEIFELVADYRSLPPPLNEGRGALFIEGKNMSDDLFMFFKRRVTGLRPAARYSASFDVEIATDVPHDCGGAGGTPGSSVWVKAGASTVEPMRVLEPPSPTGFYRMNIDIGIQANNGTDAVILGTVGNSRFCADERGYELKRLNGTRGPFVEVEADAEGAVWLLAGVDSGFMGRTSVYFTKVVASFALR